MIVALFIVLLTAQPQDVCSTVQECRTQALDAQQRQDYEAFHDLAWAAYRKGRANDPELMLLVARAQSLSGRPGDALVMLERLASAGVDTGAATDDDFARVRALPRWPEVAPTFSGEAAPAAPAPPSSAPAPSAKSPAPPTSVPAPSAKSPAPSTSVPAPSAKSPAPPTSAPAPSPKSPAPPTSVPAPSAKSPAPSTSVPAPSPRAAADPLSFTTVLTPSALVYDAVSKRFIMADRQARRIAVIDRTTGQVSTLVGAQGDLGDIGGIAIDARQGDLWVVSAAEGGAQRLHLIQLISGRLLKSVPLSGVKGQVLALAFLPDVGLVVADDTGRITRVRPDGRSETLTELEYVPRALAADGRGRLYVTAGGPRLARFTAGPSLRRTDLVELAPDMPPDAPFTVAGGRLYFVVAADGRYEIRSAPVR